MPVEMMEKHFHGFHWCTTHDGKPGYMDPSCEGRGEFVRCHVDHVEWVNKPGTPIETIWGCVHKLTNGGRAGAVWQSADAKQALDVIARIAGEQGLRVEIVVHKPLAADQKERLIQRALRYKESGGSL